jgi:hypothetical protein
MPVTFDAAYSLDGSEDVDGNFGSVPFHLLILHLLMILLHQV